MHVLAWILIDPDIPGFETPVLVVRTRVWKREPTTF